VTASYARGGAPENMFDGSSSTYYRVDDGVEWIKLEYNIPIYISSYYLLSSTNGSYDINSYEFYGSNDDVNWDLLYKNTNFPYDETVNLKSTKKYKYYKIQILSGGSSYTDVSRFEPKMLVNVPDILGLKINFQRECYINGPIENVEYSVDKIFYGDNNKELILEFDMLYHSFKNAIGEISVSYDSSSGELRGYVGLVADFNVSFTPSDLEATVNPNNEENINLSVSMSHSLIDVEYKNGFENNNINVSMGILINFEYTEVVNP